MGGNPPGRGQFLYRGQANAAWPLVPTLYRPGVHLPTALDRLRNGAAIVCKLARAKGIQLAPAQTLGVLQHYGFPTPLLDFTTDMRIAAAFACQGSPSTPQYGTIFKIYASDLEDLLADGTALGQHITIAADEIPRIRAQCGVFFTGFKSGALDRLTLLTGYSFQYDEDAVSFRAAAGITATSLTRRFPAAVSNRSRQ